MAVRQRSRPASTYSTASTTSVASLMQDVPGSYPAKVPLVPQESVDDEHVHRYTSLSQAVHARRAEYVKPKQLRIKVGTWNVAALKGVEKDLGGWFVQGKGVAESLTGLKIDGDQSDDREDVDAQEARYKRKQTTIPLGDRGALPGNEDVGLYVLGLQEVVDVNSISEALRPYTDPATATKWKDTLQRELPDGYQLVAERQLIGLLLLAYAAPSIAAEMSAVSTTSVGTGVGGYMGNKGAVSARIVLGETTRLVFVNSHLAAGADRAALERRNWDVAQILSRTKFQPIQDLLDLAQTEGEQIGEEDFAFWVGDLNYRLEGIPGDDVRRLLMLHTRNEYDLSQRSAQKIEREIGVATESAHQRADNMQNNAAGISDERSSATTTLVDDVLDSTDDPASLQTTLSSLLPHDELRQQMEKRKAFHDGWREGEITFLPTYKYDVGSVGVFDSSEKKRAPSWCDRILYRTRRGKLAYESKITEEERAREKDEEMRANGTDQAGNDEDILYDYDPDTDGVHSTAPSAEDDYDDYDQYDSATEGVVLTKEGFEDEIDLESYVAHQRVLSSDHKPLDAIFILKYDAVDATLKAKVQAEVAKEMDKRENEERPSVTVVVDFRSDNEAVVSDDNPTGFEGVYLGDVRWGQGKHRGLTIANTGRVPATFSFIERPVGQGQAPGIAPKWLSLKINDSPVSSSQSEAQSITVQPGDTCSVEINVRIFDLEVVRALNEGNMQLDDILVLRVEGGRDHFIPVRGRWQDSSLGRSIDKLCRIPEGGIRKLQHQKPHGIASPPGSSASQKSDLAKTEGGDEQPVRFSAPRELFRLTETIERLLIRGVDEWQATCDTARAHLSEEQYEHHATPTPPWHQHPSWPFDERGCHEQQSVEWQDGLSDICNALDTDDELEQSLPCGMPLLRHVELLCAMLVTFLRGLPDSLITPEQWRQIDSLLLESEKAKHKQPIEELRTSVEEVMSQSAPHSISFLILTSMLQRILSDIYPQKDVAVENATITGPAKRSKLGNFRRMTGFSKAPAPETGPNMHQAIDALAHEFADLVVMGKEVVGDRVRNAETRRKEEFLKMFIRQDHT